MESLRPKKELLGKEDDVTGMLDRGAKNESGVPRKVWKRWIKRCCAILCGLFKTRLSRSCQCWTCWASDGVGVLLSVIVFGSRRCSSLANFACTVSGGLEGAELWGIGCISLLRVDKHE